MGFARLIEGSETLTTLRSGGTRHSRGALTGSAALADGRALVTYDDRLAARARDCGVEVLTAVELLAEYGFEVL